ncbi:hypothetical protein DPEC_G00354950 [Dallia pectoralis]|uniref:Uncharacterized protein n=1 Tax=Dallia pectoralis TaxID=75939 RepID=A0ACC2EZB7_DALPE|nr:hypothetical protein DPEC_G00354950 [Dallia pectoralis]
MSKIERLNACVAKLLTVAVNEVLEVVKETVSEYQEKTDRTQRENVSLRRRLQELQDKMKRENTGPGQTVAVQLEIQNCKQEFSLVEDPELFSPEEEITEILSSETHDGLADERPFGSHPFAFPPPGIVFTLLHLKRGGHGHFLAQLSYDNERDTLCNFTSCRGRCCALSFSPLVFHNSYYLTLLAVHEVLEVVKETVSEYQEKTARTQRENESLRRRLQELQDKMRRDSTAQSSGPAPTAMSGKTEYEAESKRSPGRRQRDLESTKEDDKPVLTRKPWRRPEEDYNDSFELDQLGESETECNVTQLLAENNGLVPDRLSQVTEAAVTVYMPHSLCDTALDSIPAMHMSSNILPQSSSPHPGLSTGQIKTEPVHLEFSSVSREPQEQNPFECGDSDSSSMQNDSVLEPTQDNPEGQGIVHYINAEGLNTFVDAFPFECHPELVQDTRRQQRPLLRREESHS